MVFFTRKRAEREQVEAALREEVLALREEVAVQKIAQRDGLKKLRDEMLLVSAAQDQYVHQLEAVQEAATENLNRAIAGIVFPEIVVPEPVNVSDVRIPLLADAVHLQQQDITQLNDTVAYLLQAPPSVVTVETPNGVLAMFKQHARVLPMGAR